MNCLLIPIGNPMRGDDAVAHHVAARLKGIPTKGVHQLTPEIAAEFNEADAVIFIDADINATEPILEPVSDDRHSASLTHHLTPAGVAHLARSLFNFTGNAYLCRVPAEDFDREGLSPVAGAATDAAVDLLTKFLIDNSR